MEKKVYMHELKLSGDSEFVKKFNDCSDWFAKSNDESLTEAERNEAWEIFMHKRQCLELGI